jgi:hypothetical protein
MKAGEKMHAINPFAQKSHLRGAGLLPVCKGRQSK